MRFVPGVFDDDEAFQRLKSTIEELDKSRGTGGNFAFYLSVPPKFFPTVVSQLKKHGLSEGGEGTWRRAVIEKPFGHDLRSAQELNAVVHERLPAGPGLPDRPLPRQGDRPEHPGAALRQHDVRAAVEPQLRRPRADHDGRGHRHRRPGGLLRRHRLRPRRDPEPPAPAPRAHRDGGARLLRRQGPAHREAQGAQRGASAAASWASTRCAASTPPAGRAARRCTGTSRRRASTRSRRPTPSPRCAWRSTTAAGRACRSTCVRASAWAAASPRSRSSSSARRTRPFDATDTQELGQNALVIRVQPDEGVTIRFGSKVPGTQMEIRDVTMDFAYGESFTESSPEAYERLLLDVLLGDANLFPRHQEVERSWEILDPVEELLGQARQARAVSRRHLGPPGRRRDARTRRTELAPAMNIDLTDTTSSQINTALVEARRSIGSPAVGMVLTLVIVTDEGNHYDALRAASQASKEHPSRILVVVRRPGRSPRDRAMARLDAEVRVGSDSGHGRDRAAAPARRTGLARLQRGAAAAAAGRARGRVVARGRARAPLGGQARHARPAPDHRRRGGRGPGRSRSRCAARRTRRATPTWPGRG